MSFIRRHRAKSHNYSSYITEHSDERRLEKDGVGTGFTLNPSKFTELL